MWTTSQFVPNRRPAYSSWSRHPGLDDTTVRAPVFPIASTFAARIFIDRSACVML